VPSFRLLDILSAIGTSGADHHRAGSPASHETFQPSRPVAAGLRPSHTLTEGTLGQAGCFGAATGGMTRVVRLPPRPAPRPYNAWADEQWSSALRRRAQRSRADSDGRAHAATRRAADGHRSLAWLCACADDPRPGCGTVCGDRHRDQAGGDAVCASRRHIVDGALCARWRLDADRCVPTIWAPLHGHEDYASGHSRDGRRWRTGVRCPRAGSDHRQHADDEAHSSIQATVPCSIAGSIGRRRQTIQGA
jgi:hypothetical protein